jgi:hypothetical protein
VKAAWWIVVGLVAILSFAAIVYSVCFTSIE